jgi:hypothetical protein
MGMSCSTFGRKVLVATLKGRGRMEDIGVDDRIVLKHII